MTARSLRALTLDLFRYTNAIERARAAYYAEPITTKSYDCPRCTGYQYAAAGVCLDCRKEES